jgi:pimeloyl-ACP methyl ester carboxylesterase
LVLGGISSMEPFAVVNHDALRSAIRDGVAPGDPMTAMVAQLVQSPGQDAEALALCVEGLARTPFEAKPPVRAVPTLLVAGEDDFVAQGIEQLASALPDAKLVRVPGDHRGALASLEFRDAVLEFLD